MAQQWVKVPESRLFSWTYDTGLISTQRQDDKGLAAPSPDVAPCILPLQKLPVGRDWLLAPAGSVTSSTSVGSSVGPGYGGSQECSWEPASGCVASSLSSLLARHPPLPIGCWGKASV